MPPRKSSAAKEETPQRTGRRLRLLDHLSDGAFDDQNLQDASAKIARLSQNRVEPEVKEPPPLGEATHSITDSNTDSIDSPPIQSPIQTPIYQSVTSPNESPNETAAADLSITSVPNVLWEPVLLTENQATLYVCLKQIQGAVTSLTLISQATKISEHTLKSALKKLRQHGLIVYGGRKNTGGRFGFTAQAIERPIVLRGDRARLQKQLRQIDFGSITLSTSLSEIEMLPGEPETETNQLELDLSHLMNHRLDHRFNDSSLSSSSSSENKLLQDLERSLLLEDHFQDLDIRSLEPHLGNFETVESFQIFLDMANASITAAQNSSKPIKNPRGFLFAQLKAGFINPPSNFKSRRVQAQEARNTQLQAELAELRRLQEEEAELRFELFKAGLTEERQAELESAVAGRVKPGGPVSRERQIEVYRDEVLREWFEQERGA